MLLLSAALAVSALAVSALAVSTPALAVASIASGGSGGLGFAARPNIVAAGSTASVAGGGDPRYFVNDPAWSGVASLVMEYADGGAFACTGALVSGNSILTAAHCVSGGNNGGGDPVRVRAYFTDSADPDLVRYDAANGYDAATGAVAIDVGRRFVHPDYSGEIVDDNDIAVLRLASAAPAYAAIYGLSPVSDLAGRQFTMLGQGDRSGVGGALGADLGAGRMRLGVNSYDFSWGDPLFGGFFTDWLNGGHFFGTASIANNWLADFDDGSGARDSACLLGHYIGGTGQFCDPGTGPMEATMAEGDSGGPGFIDGRIASVSSYGLTFGSGWGDSDDELNASFGEFSGHVPVWLHRQWIASLIPEPANWVLLIAGFGAVGVGLRRRRRDVPAA